MKLKSKKQKIRILRLGKSECDRVKTFSESEKLSSNKSSIISYKNLINNPILETDSNIVLDDSLNFPEFEEFNNNNYEEYGFSNLVSNGYGSNYNGGYDSY